MKENIVTHENVEGLRRFYAILDKLLVEHCDEINITEIIDSLRTRKGLIELKKQLKEYETTYGFIQPGKYFVISYGNKSKTYSKILKNDVEFIPSGASFPKKCVELESVIVEEGQIKKFSNKIDAETILTLAGRGICKEVDQEEYEKVENYINGIGDLLNNKKED